MNRLLTTTVTDDHFQYYLPAYVRSAQLCWPDISIHIYVLGDLSYSVYDYLMARGVFVSSYHDHPNLLVSTANCMRFIHEYQGDRILITDADLIFCRVQNDAWRWAESKMMELECWGSHHGPYKKPFRPEINPEGWIGDFQRVAGGFVMVTQEWLSKTRKARQVWYSKILDGQWGYFRESDEVMLYRIARDSGIPIPKSKNIPPEARGIHLGDFKPCMDHRWKNEAKMAKYVTKHNIQLYLQLISDKLMSDAIEIGRSNNFVRVVFDNLNTFAKRSSV